MQIVIELSDETYDKVINPNNWYDPNNAITEIVKAIENGTPLPQGHGKLMILSEDKLKENQINLDFSCQKWISEVGLSNATVAIIEADKECR